MTISKIGGVGSNPTEGTTFDVRFEETQMLDMFRHIHHECRVEVDQTDDFWPSMATFVYDELKELI
jgi:hypothetical protein